MLLKESHEFIIAALSGSFDVVLNDGEKLNTDLNRSYYGLYVPNLLWRKLEIFYQFISTNSIQSISYDIKDYDRDFAREFKTILDGAKK
jgi:hypothetical protein